MSTKQLFSAAGIAASILLSGAATAETLDVTLGVGDGYDYYNHYWTDLDNAGAPEIAAGFSIQTSSNENGDGQYSNFLMLSLIEPLEYASSYYSLNADTGTNGNAAYRNLDFYNDEGFFGNYYSVEGNIEHLNYSYENPLTGERWSYMYSSVPIHIHESSYLYFYHDGGEGESVWNIDAFDVGELANRMEVPLRAGLGMFDFQNTMFHYADGSSASMGQILAADNGLQFRGNANNGLEATWLSDSLITSVTVAYATPAVPEPETWAMLLAGLGLIGSVARRRGLRA
jgi:hypothetical protein